MHTYTILLTSRVLKEIRYSNYQTENQEEKIFHYTQVKGKGQEPSHFRLISTLNIRTCPGEQNTDCHNDLTTLMSIKTNKNIPLNSPESRTNKHND